MLAKRVAGGGDSANVTANPTRATFSEALPVLRVPGWDSFAGLAHGFLGRRGGTSTGAWSTLNLSERVDDDPRAVARNWQVVRERFPDLRIARMRQVHGDRVVQMDGHGEAEEADAMLTGSAGVGLAVLTADCVPILMIAPAARAAMAVHAGWRGTVAGIAAKALDRAHRVLGLDPSHWYASLGPSIGGCCYEVGSEIGEELERRWGSMRRAWQAAGERGMLDLRMANRTILIERGMAPERIVTVGPCTACASAEFFSHRRSRGSTGRQLSIVGWI
ncbi:MAG TPA: peptidoglycan editing factor PgeF [Candidatus Binatia bacterium]|nr:peptidoglycan editing factor PgeF [Candidatus Binatia bacterium]